MLEDSWRAAAELFAKGGWAMWPLLALSLAAGTMAFERAIFWLHTHRLGRSRWLVRVADRLRKGDAAGVRALCSGDGSLYSGFALGLLERKGAEDAALELIEAARPRFERFLTALSTIYAAAPLLGILGTVSGIISSFEILGARAEAVADPALVASGIAEALLTTAAGLIVATLTLFALAFFRASARRCLSRLESLAAAAAQGFAASTAAGRQATVNGASASCASSSASS
ncbi:MAG: MotA/TolQ/ExbB proton channel family protein [Planctomycetota bacterium]|nr:MAG: MotA/TolQ/ExbB proton channel family protein [Planctomycetota bacterium]